LKLQNFGHYPSSKLDKNTRRFGDLTCCPEIKTSSIYCAQQRRYYPILPDDGDILQCPKRRVFLSRIDDGRHTPVSESSCFYQGQTMGDILQSPKRRVFIKDRRWETYSSLRIVGFLSMTDDGRHTPVSDTSCFLSRIDDGRNTPVSESSCFYQG
jgi:uncharacterized protein YbaR (Trm112 family)